MKVQVEQGEQRETVEKKSRRGGQVEQGEQRETVEKKSRRGGQGEQRETVEKKSRRGGRVEQGEQRETVEKKSRRGGQGEQRGTVEKKSRRGGQVEQSEQRETVEKKSRRGGRREGAGRKRAKENVPDPQHVTREALDRNHPVHVMLRTRKDVPRLRQRRMYEAMRNVLVRYLEQPDFRVVHISIQHNHLHLIVEAANEQVLSRRMQSFAINAARRINKAAERRGKVFQFRYKAKQLRSREYARNAIAYVLNNWRRHREDQRRRDWGNAMVDEYSSAVSFTGWKGHPRWILPDGYRPLPVSAPRTGLLTSSWMWLGLVDPFEVPGSVS